MARGKDQTTPLGERIRTRRKSLGLTAKAVAMAVGVSTSYVCQLERGDQQEPSLPMLRRVAQALSLDVHVLMGAVTSTIEQLWIPLTLQSLAISYHLPADTVEVLAGIHIDGRQPSTAEDWLFLLLAIRRACHLYDTPPPSE